MQSSLEKMVQAGARPLAILQNVHSRAMLGLGSRPPPSLPAHTHLAVCVIARVGAGDQRDRECSKDVYLQNDSGGYLLR